MITFFENSRNQKPSKGRRGKACTLVCLTILMFSVAVPAMGFEDLGDEWRIPGILALCFMEALLIIILLMHRATRIRAEKALRETEQRYKELFEHMSNGVAVYEAVNGGEDFVFKEFNFAGEKIEQVNRKDILGKRVTEVFPGVKEFGVFKVFQRVWRSGKAEYFPEAMYRDARDPGSWRENWVYKLPSGEIVAVYNDITERKQAEETLRSTNEMFRALVEVSPLAIILLDAEGNVQMWNPAAERMFGWTEQAVLGRPNPIVPADKHEEYLTLRQQLLQGTNMVNQETVRQRQDGSLIEVSISSAPLYSAEGKLRGRMAIIADITERKRVEEALDRERNLLRTLIDNLPDYIYFKDTESRFLLGNLAVAQIMGAATPDDLLGKTDFDFYPQDLAAQYYADEQEVIRSGDPQVNREEPIIDPAGNRTWILTTQVPLRESQGAIVGLVGISRDITERKRAEEEIRQLNTELEQRVRRRTAELEAANKELQSFAYVVSHDLKAPLRGISHIAHWLVEDYAAAFDDNGKELADLLIGRVKRMDNLIDGILHYSRIGRLEGNDEPIDLHRLVREVIELLAPPEQMQIVITPELPTIVGDPTRITQVFQNLVGNAVKFMDKPRGEITIGCVDDGAYWKFSVMDNGPGIAVQHQEKIFQLFQTIVPRDVRESTGVGLAIVKKIVELYGGKIWVESEPGKGSAFFFTLAKQGVRM